jgi:hypothetical protein
MGIALPQPRYSKEEFARRGDEIYDRDIAPHVSAEDKGKFVAIDIENGDYEVASDELTAADRLRIRHPDAQIWLRRLGFGYTYRFGATSYGDRP